MSKMNEIRISGVLSGKDITTEDVMRVLLENGWKFSGSVEEEKEDVLSDESIRRAVKEMADYAEEKVIKPIKEAIDKIKKNVNG